MIKEKICTRIINENLRRVQLDMPLTLPLARLNSNCEFKKRYNEWCNIQEGLPLKTNLRKRERNRKYRQKPENRAKAKKYSKKYYLKNKTK